jgi:hypothetical protein
MKRFGETAGLLAASNCCKSSNTVDASRIAIALVDWLWVVDRKTQDLKYKINKPKKKKNKRKKHPFKKIVNVVKKAGIGNVKLMI